MTIVHREPVLDEWIDYNGHLSEPYYVLVFGHATDNAMDAVGLGPAYREAHDASLYTVEAHVRYLDEVSAGAELEVRSSVIGTTSARIAVTMSCSIGISGVVKQAISVAWAGPLITWRGPGR